MAKPLEEQLLRLYCEPMIAAFTKEIEAMRAGGASQSEIDEHVALIEWANARIVSAMREAARPPSSPLRLVK